MQETLTLEFDGGSRGNPGPAAAGVVIRAADGTPIVTIGKFIGRATNNVAEYRGLILAMQKALELKAKNIIIRGDSELIIRQMNGQYRVKHPDMKVLYEEAQDLIAQFDSAKIEHNLRHKNELADKLANLAMDRKGDVDDADDTEPVAPPPAKPSVDFGCANCGTRIKLTRPPMRPSDVKSDFVCRCGEKLRAV